MSQQVCERSSGLEMRLDVRPCDHAGLRRAPVEFGVVGHDEGRARKLDKPWIGTTTGVDVGPVAFATLQQGADEGLHVGWNEEVVECAPVFGLQLGRDRQHEFRGGQRLRRIKVDEREAVHRRSRR